MLVALMGGTLHFGAPKRKDELLLELCALIGYGVLKMSNRLTPVVIHESGSQFFPASKKLHSIEHFVKRLGSIDLLGSCVDLDSVASTLSPKLKQKSFIILVGDFLGDVDLALLAKRHEIFVVIVRDRFEEEPEILGEVDFVDPSSGETAELFFGKNARDAYGKAYQQNDLRLYRHLKSLGISYVKVITDEDPFKKMMRV